MQSDSPEPSVTLALGECQVDVTLALGSAKLTVTLGLRECQSNVHLALVWQTDGQVDCLLGTCQKSQNRQTDSQEDNVKHTCPIPYEPVDYMGKELVNIYLGHLEQVLLV